LNLQYILSQIIQYQGVSKALVSLILTVFILFFFNKFFNYAGLWIMASVRTNIVKNYRNKGYNKLLALPLSYYSTNKKGDILSRMINDVQDVDSSILESLQQLLRDPLMILFHLFALSFINYKLTIFVLVLLPVAGWIISCIQRKLRKVSVKQKEKQGEMISSLEESIYGLRMIKAFDAINRSLRRFKKINKEYTRLYIKMFRRRDLSSPVGEFLGTIAVVGILIYGSSMVLSSTSPFSAELFITYLTLFIQIINPAKAMAESTANLKKGFAAMSRIDELLQTDEKIIEKPNALSNCSFSEKISFEHVCFSYENTPILQDLSFDIEKGKMLAVCGLSGAGKSTIVNLLMRFYDVSQGKITIDGIDVRDLKINTLRNLFGMVTQESILFNDTVYNNIVLGMQNVKKEDVTEAAKIADAYEFISKLENGFDTNIGDRGTRLSGGQKQRIGIARAILRDFSVFILDEATSALDTETERSVQMALENVFKNKTSIVIAHRLSTIVHADKIIVLDKGNIVEQGTHQQLSSQNGIYAKMIEMQSIGK
jgi:subfamily B ATP-binding cassette protein MsbA